MSRVLFTNPPWWEPTGKLWPRWRVGVRAGSRWPHAYESKYAWPGVFLPRRHYIPFPFFMAYAATYCAAHTDATVVVRDSIARHESNRHYEAWLARQQFDYIFLESSTPSWTFDQQWLHTLHRLQPQARLVLCGPITVALDERVFTDLPLTAIIRGEYDKGAVRVLRGEQGIIGFDLLTSREMNAAPPPWFDPRHYWHYWDACPLGQPFPQLQVWASRGCTYRCIFCVWPATMTGNDPTGQGVRRIRHYARDHLQPYLEKCLRDHWIRGIYFDDDSFNLGTRHVLDLCAMMRELKRPWSAMCRPDTLRREVWQEMHESGCFGVKLGFESGHQHVVNDIVGKSLDLEAGAATVRYLRELGMTVHGTFTYGLPGETIEEMRATKRFIASLPFSTVQESGVAENLGTPLAAVAAGAHLERYRDAQVDAQYVAATDGDKKIEQLTRDLGDQLATKPPAGE